jgi:UDP-N-acetylmuramoyl-tripeptide--D-alanyl-D-alanine ligase
MITMILDQVLALFGESESSSLDQKFSGVTIDSRKNCQGRLFVAIRGEHYDGHDYVAAAYANGAVVALVETEVECDIAQIVVDDCRQALARLANHWRHCCSATVIALTGSNGKTTVKDMLSQILGCEAPTHATRGNFNNDIGLPLTLLDLSLQDRFAVVELGANHAGEIAALAEIAEPEIVYVNNVAASHLVGFGSVQGVIEAKGELYAYCKPQHRALFNLDEAASQYWQSICVAETRLSCALNSDAEVSASWSQEDSGLSLEVHYAGNSHAIRLGVFGEHNVRNALAAISVALISGIEFERAVHNLAGFAGTTGRLQMMKGPLGSRLIDDSYNANPDSLDAGIKVLCSLQGEAWLALGDMAELGSETEALHKKAAQTARHQGVRKMFGMGEMGCVASEEFGKAGHCFEKIDEMAEAILGQIHEGVNLLVKGSRSAGMDRLVENLMSNNNRGETNHAL